MICFLPLISFMNHLLISLFLVPLVHLYYNPTTIIRKVIWNNMQDNGKVGRISFEMLKLSLFSMILHQIIHYLLHHERLVDLAIPLDFPV